MADEIKRGMYADDVSITNSLGTTEAVPLLGFAFGGLVVPSGSGLTGLTVYVAKGLNDPFVLLPSAGAAGTMTVEAARAYRLPDDVACFGAMKLVGNTSGTVGLILKG